MITAPLSRFLAVADAERSRGHGRGQTERAHVLDLEDNQITFGQTFE
jgi:hypothetical protein